MITRPESDAKIGDVLLTGIFDRPVRNRYFRAIANVCWPTRREQDVCRVCAMQCLGITNCVKWKILLLR